MKVAVIGTGSMGGMLVRAWLDSGTIDLDDLKVVNRSPEKIARLQADYPGLGSAPADEAAKWADVIWLCVRPGDTRQVLAQIGGQLDASKLLVLISNTVEMRPVEALVRARVAKVIPSVAQEVWAGAALVMHGSRLAPDDGAVLDRLLSLIARPLLVQEHQGRTAADISSCGPAFLAYILSEMAVAALAAQPDLGPEVALDLVCESLLGAALLLTKGEMSPEELVRRVKVPGGVTAAGLQELGERIPQAWEAVFAATRRVEEAKMRSL